MSDEQERLIEGALSAGLITPEQVEEAREIQKTVADIGITQSLSEILVKKEHLTEQQVRTLQRELSSSRIGKYEILEKIGVGGAGVVYRAKHATLGRVVALKVLTNKRASDEQYLERFVREARIAVTLNHRNIVRGLDYGESGGYHYFVMEFVPGDTLYEVIQREGRIEEDRALEIGVQVAKALEHALEYDLSHRDLKPDNILISVETSEAKVCDLGLAKPKRLETSGPQSSGAAIGTPSYIAPEQIRGIDDADTRSDIYSLGATLFHALCGRPPFEGKSVDELLRKHLTEEAPDPRGIVVELQSSTAAVLLKMLAKKPEDRYQRLSDLIADLEAVRDGRPPVHTIAFARKGPSVSEGRSRAELSRQGNKPLKLLGGLAAVIIVIVVFALVMGGSENGKKDPVRPVVKGTTDQPKKDPVVVIDREAEARKALIAAQSFWEANPGHWSSAASRFRFVIDKHAETRFAIDAKEGLKTVLADWKLKADEVWRELDRDVEKRVDRGEFGPALEILASFPKDLRDAEGVDAKISKRRDAIETAAGDAWTKASAEAKKEAEDLRFPEALAAIRDLRTCGIPGIEVEAKAAYKAITKMRDEVGGLRAEGEKAFRELYGTILLQFGAEGYDAAFSRLEKARDDAVYRYAQDALEGTSLDLNRLGAFVESIRRGFERQQGRTVTLLMADGRSVSSRLENAGRDGLRVRRAGNSSLVPWNEISVEARAEAALKALGAMKPESRFDAAMWLMSQGRLELASRQLEAAENLGGEIAPYEKRVEDVRYARDIRVETLLGQANVHLLEGHTTEAADLLDQAVAFAPDHAGARYRRGLVLGKLGRGGAAITDFERAVALGEKDPLVHFELARLYENAGRLSEALASYDRFLKTSPEGDAADEAGHRSGEIRGRLSAGKARALRTDADTKFRKRQWKEALALYKEADGLVPDDPKVVLGIAKSSHRLALIFEAYIGYRRYLDLRPRGSTGPREARKAVTSLEAAYVNPPEALGDFGAGELALVNNKIDEAIDCFDAGLEKAPLSAITYFNRASAWYSKAMISGAGSHSRSAIADYDRVLLLDPGYGKAFAGRALCWLALRKYESSLEDARRAMGMLPEDALSRYTAGLAANALEQYPDAIGYFDHAIKLAPKDATYRIGRARTKWLMRDLDGALADLKTASELEITPEQGTEIEGLQDKIRLQKEQRR